jgi:WD40 repeat protein
MSDPSNPPSTAPGPAGGAPPDPQSGPALYRIGTLAYTKAGLFMLFGWLLWGDFCFTLFEHVGGPDILKLYLQDSFKVSNLIVTVLFVTIPMAIGVVVGPILSFKSDRHRGKRGRRIPYILWTTPFLCLFAAAIGYADDIISLTKTMIPPDSALLDPFVVSMLLIAFLVIGFSFFNEFVNTVFWYLFADVVPREFMGRFLGLFRVVGAGAGFLLNYFLGEYMLSHMRVIHVGVAILYFVGFTLMCLRVKEGEYPPVLDVTEKTSFMDKVRLYFKECFTHPIFLLVYASSFVFVFARTASLSPVFVLHMGKHTATVEAAHTGSATAIAATPDGGRAVTVGTDGAVRLWDGQFKPQSGFVLDAVKRGTLQEIKRLAEVEEGGPGHHAVAMARDGSWAAAAGADGVIRLWSIADGGMQKITGHAGAVHSLALSPDGGRLASGGEDGSVRLWAMPSGAPLDSFTGPTAIRSLAFSRSGDRLASGAQDGAVSIHRFAAPGETLSFKAPGPVYALAFTPSLRPIAAPARTGPLGNVVLDWPILYVRDVFTNESLYDRPSDQRSAVLAEDGWLASGGQEKGDDSQNARVRIWNTDDGTEVASLIGHKQAITALVYKPELHLLVSGSKDKSLRLWDPSRRDPSANDNAVKNLTGYTQAVTGLVLPDQGPAVLSTSADGGLHSWNSDAGISLKKTALMASFFGIISLILAYPMGALVDRFHAVRISLYASIALIPIPFLTYFLVFDYRHLVMMEMFKVPIFAVIAATTMPLLISLFPKDTFGQMCSANGLVKQASTLALGLVGAVLMDALTRKTLLTENFRYAWLWWGTGFALQAFVFWLIYREWNRLGGIKAYKAPGSTDEAKGDPPPAAH